MSQHDVARAMGVSQSRVSRIECGDVFRTEVSTVAAYIRALGGDVRVVARVDGQDITVG